MSTYQKIYSLNEYNFQLELASAETENVLIVNVFKPCEVEIVGCRYTKTDGTGTEVRIQTDIYELEEMAEGGVETVLGIDYLLANRDLNKDHTPAHFEVVKDAIENPLVYLEEGSLNIFRDIGVAVKGEVSYTQGMVFFSYSLKPMTSYLIKTTVLAGGTSSSKTFIYGIAREK